jgi:hypothetical protein
MAEQRDFCEKLLLINVQNRIVDPRFRDTDYRSTPNYAGQAIQEIVDMPDRPIDLFIQFCLQGGGGLSAKKRASHFDFLTDEELSRRVPCGPNTRRGHQGNIDVKAVHLAGATMWGRRVSSP